MKYFIAAIIVILILVSLKLVGDNQEVRIKAAGTTASLSLDPSNTEFNINEVKPFTLSVSFTNGSPQSKVDYVKTEIIFDKDYLSLPSGKYVDTSKSGFKRIMRVDGPQIADENGKIIIELGADAPGNSPATDKVISLATIYFIAKQTTDVTKDITIGTTQLVSNEQNIPIDDSSSNGAKYSILPLTQPTSTNGATPTNTPVSPLSSVATSIPTVLPTLSLNPTVTLNSYLFPTTIVVPATQMPYPTISNEIIAVNATQNATPTSFPYENFGYVSPTPPSNRSIGNVIGGFFSFVFCGLFKFCK